MDFQRKQILNKALEDSTLKALVEQNNISAEVLDRDFLNIYSYMINKKKCAGCTSLNECKQDMIGSMPEILYNGNVYFDFIPCPYLQKANKGSFF